MNLTRRNKSMNPRPLRILHCIPRRANIVSITPRQPANHRHMPILIYRIAHLFRDNLHRVKIIFRRRGKPSLDNIDAELRQLAGNVELLLAGHGGAGGLLAVSEGGVEDANVVGVIDAVGDVFGAESRADWQPVREDFCG